MLKAPPLIPRAYKFLSFKIGPKEGRLFQALDSDMPFIPFETTLKVKLPHPDAKVTFLTNIVIIGLTNTI